jgi:hypothetical protein
MARHSRLRDSRRRVVGRLSDRSASRAAGPGSAEPGPARPVTVGKASTGRCATGRASPWTRADRAAGAPSAAASAQSGLYNYQPIYQTPTSFRDGGSVYTLSASPGTVIERNGAHPGRLVTAMSSVEAPGKAPALTRPYSRLQSCRFEPPPFVGAGQVCRGGYFQRAAASGRRWCAN